MLNNFRRRAKSCFPLQRIFHASNLSVECGGSGVSEVSTQGQGWLPSGVSGFKLSGFTIVTFAYLLWKPGQVS